MIFRAIAGLALCAALARDLAAAEFSFGALGDTPYTWFEEAHFPGLLAGMSDEDLAFVVHVGDFKAARAPCSDELFRQRRNLDGGRITFPYKPVRRNDARVLAME